MQYLRLILLVSFLVASQSVFAVDDMQSEGNVEEPDAPDDSDMQVPSRSPAVGSEHSQPSPKPDVKSPVGASEEGDANYDQVVLRGLNKVTAHAQTIKATIGSAVRFGTVEIIAHRCWKAAPDERPENAALLEISEIKQGEAPAQIFLGWMFSSSPGLSALEHPFYDITVVACEKTEGEKLPPAQGPAPKKANAKPR